MKLHVLSDLHIEFAPFDLPETDVDVLVLAGDIGVGTRGIEQAQVWAQGRPVVYVAGNHEYYRGSIPRLTTKLATTAEACGVHFLENRSVVVNGARFLGCTLWTDFGIFGDRDHAARVARAVMNDFRLIRKDPEYRAFQPVDAWSLHQRSVAWLQAQLEQPFDGPTVVVTHHAPSLRSVAPEYQADPITAAYVSDLSRLLNGQATLWVHGHTHFAVDYIAGGTRVVANQRGYPDAPAPGFDPARVVEIAV